MKNVLLFLLILFLISLFLPMIGCGSSKPSSTSSQDAQQDDLGEIERLLGINADEKNKSKTESGDDLLSLLKADEKKNASSSNTSTTTTTTTAPVTQTQGEDKRVVGLQKKVDNLEGQVNDKNKTIANLRAQLLVKDEQIKTAPTQKPIIQAQPEYIPPSSTKSSFTYSGGSISDTEFERGYQEALDMFHSNQYRAAIDAFESLLSINRNHSLSDNTQYWIGECYYALGNYKAAVIAFEKVFTFKKSNKNDYSQYKLGLSYFQMGDKERSRAEFQNLLDNYNNPELVDKAQEYLARIQ
jgi:TolA-binding protein